MDRVGLRRRRRIWAIAPVVALSISVLQPTIVAAGTGSNTVSGVALADGGPISSATVVITVVPRLEDGATAADGTPIDETIVGQGKTNIRGRFSLKLDAIASGFIDEFGIANFRATVTDGTKQLTWSFPLMVGTDAQETHQRRDADFRFELGSHPGAADSANPPAKWQGITSSQLTPDGLSPTELSDVAGTPLSAMAGGDVEAAALACQWIWTSEWRYAVDEAFANVWGWTGAKSTFHQSLSTSHTLGIAIQLDSGSYSLGGTVGFTESTGTAANVSGLYNNQVNNEVNYRKIRNACLRKSEWRPVSTASLMYPILGWAQSAHPIWTSCAVYGNGANMTKSSGTNTTYATGVNFPSIKLSTQSGWNASVSNTWNFTQTSKLCGSTSSGWVSSPEAEAHQ